MGRILEKRQNQKHLKLNQNPKKTKNNRASRF
jgi:hypothetical protein